MKNKKNGQPVQKNLTDKKGSKNKGTEANPKREGNNIPEKITLIENKKEEKTGDLQNKQLPDKTKIPVADENPNTEKMNSNFPKGELYTGPNDRKDSSLYEQNKTETVAREDEFFDEDAYQDNELDENDDPVRYKRTQLTK